MSHRPFPIVSVQERFPRFKGVRQVLFSVAELGLPFPGEEHLVRIGVPIPQPDLGSEESLL